MKPSVKPCGSGMIQKQLGTAYDVVKEVRDNLDVIRDAAAITNDNLDHIKLANRNSPNQHSISSISGLEAELAAKQQVLQSGVNIKTIGGQHLLGDGDVELTSENIIGLTDLLDEVNNQLNTTTKIAGKFADGFVFRSEGQIGVTPDGQWWSYNGSLPFTVPAGTVPSEPNYTNRGDAALRSALASPDSAVLVGGSKAGSVGSINKSVIDFGADPLGVIDSTTAFHNAALAGYRVTIPTGTYRVANIPIENGMNLEGVGSKSVTLLVTQNDAGAFYTAGTSLKADIKLKGVTIRAADGVTGACAVKQGTKAEYLAYVEFLDVETWADLKHSYDALFIFTSWAKCRDGYSGTPPAAQTHSMLKSVPAAYGQVNQLNLNQMYKCQMFRSNDPNGCLHIEYGSVFSVVDSDFEQLDCRAINARGILNLALTNNWYEYIRSPKIITLANSPAPNALGCRAVTVVGGNVLCDATNQTFIEIGGNSNATIEDIVFAAVPTNMTLTTLKAPTSHRGVQVLSGSPTNFFSLRPTALANNNIDNSVRPSAYMSSIKANRTKAGDLSVGSFSAGTAGTPAPGLTAVSSEIGSGSAVRVTLSNYNTWVYHSMPAKTAAHLSGKPITVSVAGHATSGFNENITVAIWVNVETPTASNITSSGGATLANNSNLIVANHSYTLPSNVTSLAIGLISGGNAASQTFNIEAVDCYLGLATPNFPELG